MTGDARVPRLSIEEAKRAAEKIGLPAQMTELSVFRVLLRHPELCKAIFGLLGQLLFRGKLDARLRELVILRLGWATGSEYEWTQHWRVAKQLGVSEADMLAVRDWRGHAGFGAAERAVLAATDETLESGAISEPTWRAAHRGTPARGPMSGAGLGREPARARGRDRELAAVLVAPALARDSPRGGSRRLAARRRRSAQPVEGAKQTTLIATAGREASRLR